MKLLTTRFFAFCLLGIGSSCGPDYKQENEVLMTENQALQAKIKTLAEAAVEEKSKAREAKNRAENNAEYIIQDVGGDRIAQGIQTLRKACGEARKSAEAFRQVEKTRVDTAQSSLLEAENLVVEFEQLLGGTGGLVGDFRELLARAGDLANGITSARGIGMDGVRQELLAAEAMATSIRDRLNTHEGSISGYLGAELGTLPSVQEARFLLEQASQELTSLGSDLMAVGTLCAETQGLIESAEDAHAALVACLDSAAPRINAAVSIAASSEKKIKRAERQCAEWNRVRPKEHSLEALEEVAPRLAVVIEELTAYWMEEGGAERDEDLDKYDIILGGHIAVHGGEFAPDIVSEGVKIGEVDMAVDGSVMQMLNRIRAENEDLLLGAKPTALVAGALATQVAVLRNRLKRDTLAAANIVDIPARKEMLYLKGALDEIAATRPQLASTAAALDPSTEANLACYEQRMIAARTDLEAAEAECEELEERLTAVFMGLQRVMDMTRTYLDFMHGVVEPESNSLAQVVQYTQSLATALDINALIEQHLVPLRGADKVMAALDLAREVMGRNTRSYVDAKLEIQPEPTEIDRSTGEYQVLGKKLMSAQGQVSFDWSRWRTEYSEPLEKICAAVAEVQEPIRGYTHSVSRHEGQSVRAAPHTHINLYPPERVREGLMRVVFLDYERDRSAVAGTTYFCHPVFVAGLPQFLSSQRGLARLVFAAPDGETYFAAPCADAGWRLGANPTPIPQPGGGHSTSGDLVVSHSFLIGMGGRNGLSSRNLRFDLSHAFPVDFRFYCDEEFDCSTARLAFNMNESAGLAPPMSPDELVQAEFMERLLKVDGLDLYDRASTLKLHELGQGLAQPSGSSSSTNAAVLPDLAFADLMARDHAIAVSLIDEALAASGLSDQDYAELRLARCEALAYVDGAKAEAEFKSLVQGGAEIGLKQYSLIAGALIGANAMVNAVNVVDMGVKAFPDDAKMASLLEKVKEAATDTNRAALDALKGMGYLGGSPAPESTKPKVEDVPDQPPLPLAALCQSPVYPTLAIQRGWVGVVVARVRVGTTGEVLSVVLEESSGYSLLDRAALDSLATWRFQPGQRAGMAAEMDVIRHIEFRL